MEIKNRLFRLLKYNEIDCRVSTVKEKGFSILLYKDARCDMNILDESVGAMNWKREHTRDNANCIVSLWDKEKAQWISKEDTGTESFTEKAKRLASDSFKRACFNWGIGRELYTVPFIWIKPIGNEIISKGGGKFSTYTKLTVKSITYNGSEIESVVLIDKKGLVRFDSSNKSTPPAEPVPKSKEKPKYKPELIPNNSIWDGVVKAIKGGYTIEQVKSKYKISEVNEAKLKEELNEAKLKEELTK